VNSFFSNFIVDKISTYIDVRISEDEYGLEDIISFIGSDDGILKTKPNADICEAFCKNYQISSDEVCMVGDIFHDMLFAKNSNIAQSIYITSGGYNEEVSKLANFTIKELVELLK